MREKGSVMGTWKRIVNGDGADVGIEGKRREAGLDVGRQMVVVLA